jgi:hypothetical protein
MCLRKSKGDSRRDTADKYAMHLPISPYALLADLIHRYTTYHTSDILRKVPRLPPPLTFNLGLSPRDDACTWQAFTTLLAWVTQACVTIGVRPPAWPCVVIAQPPQRGCFRYVMHRSAPPSHYYVLGDWAKNNDVTMTEGKYFGPTMAPSRVVWRFFG